jgi:hypothetical protein
MTDWMPIPRGWVAVNATIIQAAKDLLDGGLDAKPSENRARLRRIVAGGTKKLDVKWWRVIHGVEFRQVLTKQEESFKARLAALKAMTDPLRNSNAPERRVAEATLARLLAKGPVPPYLRSAPGLEDYDRLEADYHAERERRDAAFRAEYRAAQAFSAEHQARRGNTAQAKSANRSSKAKPAPPLNTTKPKPAADPLNTTKATSAEPPLINTTKPKKPRSADRHREPNRDRHRPGYMRDYLRDYMRRRRAAEKASS